MLTTISCECRLKQGAKAQAQAAFMAAVRCRPDLTAAHIELGAPVAGRRPAEDAAVHLENAIRLDGTNDRAPDIARRSTDAESSRP